MQKRKNDLEKAREEALHSLISTVESVDEVRQCKDTLFWMLSNMVSYYPHIVLELLQEHSDRLLHVHFMLCELENTMMKYEDVA